MICGPKADGLLGLPSRYISAVGWPGNIPRRQAQSSVLDDGHLWESVESFPRVGPPEGRINSPEIEKFNSLQQIILMKLDLQIKDNKIFIPLKRKWLIKTPEEEVRQKYIVRLVLWPLFRANGTRNCRQQYKKRNQKCKSLYYHL